MEILGMWISIAGIMAILWYVLKHTNNENYENGYWAGRSAGWKSCLDHQAKMQAMKLDQVFDYDKN